MSDRTCSDCTRSYVYDRKAGHGATRCNSCWQAKRRARRKEQIYQYYGSRSCTICKYEGPDKALTFHHVNPDAKEFVISGSECRAWIRVKAELDKCVLLCVRCHAEVHAGMHEEWIEAT